MAENNQSQTTLTKTKLKRKSYTREKKLEVLEFYKSHQSNLYQTSKKFSLNTKTILRWIKDEEKIKESKKGSRYYIKHANFGVLYC